MIIINNLFFFFLNEEMAAERGWATCQKSHKPVSSRVKILNSAVWFLSPHSKPLLCNCLLQQNEAITLVGKNVNLSERSLTNTTIWDIKSVSPYLWEGNVYVHPYLLSFFGTWYLVKWKVLKTGVLSNTECSRGRITFHCTCFHCTFQSHSHQVNPFSPFLSHSSKGENILYSKVLATSKSCCMYPVLFCVPERPVSTAQWENGASSLRLQVPIFRAASKTTTEALWWPSGAPAQPQRQPQRGSCPVSFSEAADKWARGSLKKNKRKQRM